MFNIKLDESKTFNNALSVISDFITEATFKIQKDGVKLTAMDPANISMVILDMLPSAFTNYKVEKETEITVNLENLSQAVKRAKATDPISLTIDNNKLILNILGKSIKKFQIPLLENETKQKEKPNLEFKTRIEMDTKELKNFVDDAMIVGDALKFKSEKDKLELFAGDSGSKVKIILSEENDSLLKLETKSTSKSIYSLEYLKKISKAATLSDTAVLQFSDDYPLKIDFKSLDKLQMSFILAPRIENE